MPPWAGWGSILLLLKYSVHTKPKPVFSFNLSCFLQSVYKWVSYRLVFIWSLVMMREKYHYSVTTYMMIETLSNSSFSQVFSRNSTEELLRDLQSKTQELSQVTYIRAVLELVLNVIKTNIRASSTRGRSNIERLQSYLLLPSLIFFDPLLCRKKHPLWSQEIVYVNVSLH